MVLDYKLQIKVHLADWQGQHINYPLIRRYVLENFARHGNTQRLQLMVQNMQNERSPDQAGPVQQIRHLMCPSNIQFFF